MLTDLWQSYLTATADVEKAANELSLERRKVTLYWEWKWSQNRMIPLADFISILQEARFLGATEVVYCIPRYVDTNDFCTTTRLETDAELVSRVRTEVSQLHASRWLDPAFAPQMLSNAAYAVARTEVDCQYGHATTDEVIAAQRQLNELRQAKATAEDNWRNAQAVWNRLKLMGLVAEDDNVE